VARTSRTVVAAAAITNLFPDFYNKIGTNLKSSAAQRFRQLSGVLQTRRGRSRAVPTTSDYSAAAQLAGTAGPNKTKA
jgi:hypothetical protein